MHIGTQRYYIAKLDQAVALQLGTLVLILSWRGRLTLRRYWAA
jgi:hypothetical protein